MEHKEIKPLTHEELVQEVYRMAQQLSHKEQQEIKNRIELDKTEAL